MNSEVAQQRDIEQRVSNLLIALKRLNERTTFVLDDEDIEPGSLFPRNQYLHGLLGLGLAFSEAALSAAEKDQVRGVIPELRSLQECWINGRFVCCTRGHIWLYHTILQDELEQTKKRDKLHAAGHLDEARYKARSKEAKKIINVTKRRYPELPLIPQLIVNDRGVDTRKLKLKDKCKVIDHYQSLRPHKTKRKNTTMVEHYELVYNHMSETTHATPFAINDLYKIGADGKKYLDVHGKTDRRFLAALLLNVYLYQCELLDRFTRRVAKKNTKLPPDIQDTVKQLLADK